MPELTVRDPTKAERKAIADWLIEDIAGDPFFRKTMGSPWRRWLYRTVVMPRYLGSGAYPWALEQDGALAGYAIVVPRGLSVHISDLVVRPGYDKPSLVSLVLLRAENLARESEYPYLRVAPLATSDAELAPYRAAGLDFLDYYLYAYTGTVAGAELPPGLGLAALPGPKALGLRLRYLDQELEAAAVPPRDLIEDTLLPSRPPQYPSFAITREGEEIGYLGARPDERGDGVLTLVLSAGPETWGTDLEPGVIAGYLGRQAAGQPVATRVLLCTTAHCQQSDTALAAIQLQRGLDARPVLYKKLA
jgi:ribosomal protein S18 acetylase RimI-like enzyme